MEEQYREEACVFKAFCDENRLMILHHLQEGEKCACELLEVIGVSQSTLSHHMKILCESGIVTSRKEGKWTHYKLSQQGIIRAEEILKSLKREEKHEEVR